MRLYRKHRHSFSGKAIILVKLKGLRIPIPLSQVERWPSPAAIYAWVPMKNPVMQATLRPRHSRFQDTSLTSESFEIASPQAVYPNLTDSGSFVSTTRCLKQPSYTRALIELSIRSSPTVPIATSATPMSLGSTLGSTVDASHDGATSSNIFRPRSAATMASNSTPPQVVATLSNTSRPAAPMTIGNTPSRNTNAPQNNATILWISDSRV